MPLREVVQYRDDFTLKAIPINLNLTRILSCRKFKLASIEKMIGYHSYDGFLSLLVCPASLTNISVWVVRTVYLILPGERKRIKLRANTYQSLF